MISKRHYNYTKYSKIAPGQNSVFGLTQGGDLYAWGTNYNGNIGADLTKVDWIMRKTPEYGTGFSDIKTGTSHVLAVKNGVLYSWGANFNGALCVIPDRSSPVSVVGAHSFADLFIGRYHSAGIKSDGTAWTWGFGTSGQLGDNTIITRSSPVSVVGNHSFATLSIGAFSSYGLKADGTLWCWGLGTSGQLGDGSVASKSSPISLAGNHSFIKVAAGGSHVVAVKADGRYWSWGNNAAGQLGIMTSMSSPVMVASTDSFVKMATGLYNVGALRTDGTAWMWGSNTSGQLGDRTITAKSVPISVHGAHSFVQISLASNISYGLKASGDAWSWGDGSNGALGDFTTTAKSSPVSVVGNHSFIKIIGGGYRGLALKSNGTAWAWGYNSNGDLGTLSSTYTSSPVSVVGNHSFVDVFSFYGNMCPSIGLKSDGTAWAWGNNLNYSIGDRSMTSKSSPVSVHGAHSFISIAVGDTHALGLKADGTCWAWGYNGSGQLGVNSITSYSSPVLVLGGHSFIAIYAGISVSFAKKSNGLLYAWGIGTSGQLGTNTILSASLPTPIVGNHSFTNVGGLYTASAGIKADGSIWTWGIGTNGELGIGKMPGNYSNPVIGTDASFIDVSSGYSHTLGKRADGITWGWGLATSGQLGYLNTTTSQPVITTGNHSFMMVECGSIHSIGLKQDGVAWTFGSNTYGQLGDNSATTRSSPVSVVGWHSFVSIGAGATMGYGLKSNGSVWVWGGGPTPGLINNMGQLGNGEFNNQSSPVSVIGNHSFVRLIVGGTDDHTFALKSDGSAWGWGANNYGQLGNGMAYGDYYTPQPVDLLPTYMEWKFAQVAPGYNFTMALKSDGTLWGWGNNQYYVLGNTFQNNYISSPISVVGNHSFINVAAGTSHVVAVKADGSVWTWGANTSYGACGDWGDRSSPVSVMANANAYQMAIGSNFAVFITNQGVPWTWGSSNAAGQLGYDDSTLVYSYPRVVVGNHSFIQISAGASHVVAVKSDGTCWTWGGNTSYQLGEIGQRSSPVVAIYPHSFIKVLAGSCSFGLKSDGTIWGVGLNDWAALGNNSITRVSSPVSVVGNHSFIDIASDGYYNTIGLKVDGSIWSWGYNNNNQLGDATATTRSSPVSVVGNHSFAQIGTAGYNMLMLKADGTAWSWGLGTAGQIGDFTATGKSSPVSVVGNHSFIQLTGQFYTNYGLKADGTAWSWGSYALNNGALGTNDTTNKSSPVSVVGNHSFIKLSAGVGASAYGFVLALKANGSAWTWGRGDFGQLGIYDAAQSKSSPVSVVGNHSFIDIAAANAVSYGLKSDGTLWSWGLNQWATLGDNTLTNKSSPVSVVGNHSFIKMGITLNANANNNILLLKTNNDIPWGFGSSEYGGLFHGRAFGAYSSPVEVAARTSFSSVTAGANHSVGLQSNGTAWCWGLGTSGQMGNRTAVNQSDPVSVVGNHSFIKIGAGTATTYGLKSNGTAWAWGLGTSGETGENTGLSRSSPVSVTGNHSFVDLVIGGGTAYARKSDGSIWVWGLGAAGQTAQGTTAANVGSPVKVIGSHSFTDLNPGMSHVIAVKADGTLWAWGAGAGGRLGFNNDAGNKSSPISVVGNHSFIKLTKNNSGFISAAIKSDNQIWVWGPGQLGDLGLGRAKANYSQPILVPGNHSYISVAAGYDYTIALRADGSAHAWGLGTSGQLGDLTLTTKADKGLVAGGHSFIEISLASQGSTAIARKAEGTLWTWGLGASGQMGDLTLANKSSPTSVVGNHNCIEAIAGQSHMAAVRTDGVAITWGANITSGECGDWGDRSSPVLVLGNFAVSKVASGVYFSTLLTTTGTAWTWGVGTGAQLGDNTLTNKSSPVSVVGNHSFIAIDSGYTHNIALKSNGTAWAWGTASVGQLGDSFTTTRSSPVSVVGAHSFFMITAAAGYTNYGIKLDGTLWAWGTYSNGVLGTNDTANKSSPVSVVGNHSFIKVSGCAGGTGLALKADGTAWTWGLGTSAQLGDRSITSKSSPVSVHGAHSFIDITGVQYGMLALKADGTAWSWGTGSTGQLGNNSVLSFSSPVSVVGNHSFIKISAGATHVLALKADGSVWGWGAITTGRLGPVPLGTTIGFSSPISIIGNHSFIDLGIGTYRDLSTTIKSDNTLWIWGPGNTYGETGLARMKGNYSAPIMVPPSGASYISISANGPTTYGLMPNGLINSWGSNTAGQLGITGGVTAYADVNQIGSVASYVSVHAGTTHAFARNSDGILFAFGGNSNGQLGNARDLTSAYAPIMIGNLSPVAIFHNGQNGYCLLSDGQVRAWGYGSPGSLGDAGSATRSFPTLVAANHSFAFLAGAGNSGSTLCILGLKADGSVWGWGYNSQGELGINSTTQQASPIRAVGNHSFVSLACGSGNHSLGLKSDGSAWAWGYNGMGQLGDLTATAKSSPVSVVGNHSFIKIAANYQSSYGLKSNGTLWAWGYGTSGQIGYGGWTHQSSPVSVIGNHSFIDVFGSPQGSYITAVKADGTAWAWGGAPGGQLNTLYNSDLFSPVMILGCNNDQRHGQRLIQDSFIKINTQSNTSAGIKSDGSLYMWGDLGYDALGRQYFPPGYYANIVPDAVLRYKFTDFAVGATHTLGLLADGSVWAWGDNASGQLGYDLSRSSPVSVIGNHSFANLLSGSYGLFQILLKSDGSPWGWGENSSGTLGITSSIASYSSPVSVCAGNHTFIQIAGGNSSAAYGLKSDGRAWAWGYNAQGQLGDLTITSKTSPVQVTGNHSFVQIAGGGMHGLGLKADGTMWCWGYNTNGQLGDGTITSTSSPVSVAGNHSFVQISAAGNCSYGLKSNGQVWAWGDRFRGGVGNGIAGSSGNVTSPVLAIGGHSFIKVVGGVNEGAIALKIDGSVWGWGYNNYGQLAINALSPNGMSSPTLAVGNHSFIDIAYPSTFMALKADGSVWTSGSNTSGKLGDGTITDRSSPVSVIGGHSFIKISGSSQSPLGLKADGSAWAWGTGAYGTTGIYIPKFLYKVAGNHSFAQINAGASLSSGLKSDGTAWCWGGNGYGGLGDLTTTGKSSPVPVVGSHSFTTLVSGSYTSYGLKSNGTLWAWGYSYYGECGTLSGVWFSSPVSVTGNHSFVSISYGMGLKSNGTAWCWGLGLTGQLGNAASLSASSPVSVAGNHSFIQISGYTTNKCALKSDGSVWAWGNGSTGANGDQSSANRNSPVRVAGNHSFISIACGLSHIMAVKSDGGVWAWGYNSSGQLGRGNTISTSSPVLMLPSIINYTISEPPTY